MFRVRGSGVRGVRVSGRRILFCFSFLVSRFSVLGVCVSQSAMCGVRHYNARGESGKACQFLMQGLFINFLSDSASGSTGSGEIRPVQGSGPRGDVRCEM